MGGGGQHPVEVYHSFAGEHDRKFDADRSPVLLRGGLPMTSVPEFIDPVLGMKTLVFAKTCAKRSFSI